MTLVQRKNESQTGASQAITNSQPSRDLLSAFQINLGTGGSQLLTVGLGLEISVTATGGSCLTRWFGAAGNDAFAWRWIGSYRGPGAGQKFPTNTGVLYQGMSTTSQSSGSFPWKARFPANGNMAWQDYVGGAIPLISGAHAPAADTEYEYAIEGNRATGSITIVAMDLNGTVLATWQKTSGANLGPDPLYGIDAEAPNNQAGITRIRRLQMDDGRTTRIPAWVDAANQPPSAAVDAVRAIVAAGATWQATVSGIDTDGTIAGYVWERLFATASVAALSGTTSQTVSGVAPAAGNIDVVRAKVVDNGGLPSTWVQKEICVPSNAPTVGMLPDTSGGFIRNGTQASDGAALSSGNDADNLEAPLPVSSTPQTLRARVIPMTPRTGAMAGLLRAAKFNGTSAHIAARLMYGTQNVGDFPLITLTDTYTDYPLNYSAAQVDALTALGPFAWVFLFIEADVTS